MQHANLNFINLIIYLFYFNIVGSQGESIDQKLYGNYEPTWFTKCSNHFHPIPAPYCCVTHRIEGGVLRCGVPWSRRPPRPHWKPSPPRAPSRGAPSELSRPRRGSTRWWQKTGSRSRSRCTTGRGGGAWPRGGGYRGLTGSPATPAGPPACSRSGSSPTRCAACGEDVL